MQGKYIKSIAFKVVRIVIIALVIIVLIQNHLLFPRYITGGVISKEKAYKEIKDQGFTVFEDIAILSPNFSAPAKGTIVVLHGNGGWSLQRTYIFDALTALGYRVIVYEYPGYGWRQGTTHSKEIIPEVINILTKVHMLHKEPIILWGESVGSGIAAQVYSRAPGLINGVVLTLPWSSLKDVIRQRFIIPIDYFSQEKLDSIKALKHIKCPIVIGYAEKDRTIDPKLSQKLFDSIPTKAKKLIIFKGADHNTYPVGGKEPWWKEATSFIAEHEK